MNNKIEELADLIVREGITSETLDKIADYFNVDGCTIICIKDFDLTLVESSSYFKENKIDIVELYNNTKEENLLLYEAIKKGYLVVNNYQDYKGFSSLWREIGLKSVLLFRLDAEFNAVLGLESFEKPRKFTSEDIKDIAFLSRFITVLVENKMFKDFLQQEILNLEVERPKCSDLSCLKSWVEGNLKKILDITKAKAVSLVFPKRNLYAFVDVSAQFSCVSFKKVEKVKSMLSYKMFERRLKGVAVFRYELSKDRLKCFKNIKQDLSIDSILIIPIWDDGELIATVGYGYVHDYMFSVYDINITTLLTRQLLKFLDEIKEYHKLKNVISKNEEEIINSFIITIEMKDVYTKGHSQRVAFYSKRIAENLGLTSKQVERIYIAGLLHDIGKISLPDSVLLKPSSLSEIEFEIIKYHPVLSYEIVKRFKTLPDLKSIAEMVRHHHERCDGSGYPDGLDCSKLSKGAKILAIADVFDALTTSRPYRKAFSVDEAIQIMISEKWHFDENLLKESIDVLKKSFNDAMEMSQKSLIPEAFDEYKKKFSNVDYLTGLLKRDIFLKNVDNLLALKKNFKIYLVDVKDMDFINLTHSTVFGDELLMKTAAVLSELTKYGALFLSRFGGDSFIFALPYSKKVDNVSRVEGFLKGLSDEVSKRLNHLDKDFKVKFTIASVDSSEGKTPIELIYILRKRKRMLSI
ncbi:HD domain-containing phosphohydrolase [Hippea alviniae]|uniref:HD domain-containing phosphohydrolase n=1 Tax=Hippea alviniae TaxID=1279027 RepID=UPI0003B34598|nr:HD domain-containing phosphohydrolase [Hippea alviniae]